MDKQSLLPIDCATVRKKLSAFADGESPSDFQKRIEAHLETCPECRQALEDLRCLWRTLEDPLTVRTRPGFTAEVLRKLDHTPHQRSGRWSWILEHKPPAYVAVGMVSLLAVLMGGWMGNSLFERALGSLGENLRVGAGQSATIEALDVFAPIPKGSLAEGYLVLAGEMGQVKR